MAKKHGFVPGVCWFTNLDIKKRHEDLFLSATYYKKDGSVPQASLDRWPHYDNYDAIEVSKVKDIPVDYAGVMGVPITFLDKYNPEQFEILGITKTWFGGASKMYGVQEQVDKNGKTSNVTKLNDGPVLKVDTPPIGKTYYIVDGMYYIQAYARICIRARHPHPAGVPVTFDEYDE